MNHSSSNNNSISPNSSNCELSTTTASKVDDIMNVPKSSSVGSVSSQRLENDGEIDMNYFSSELMNE
jgi:hypothetical protein